MASDAERIRYLELVGSLGDELGRAFVDAVHGEPVEVLDHIAIVASGKVDVPNERLRARAAAEVLAMSAADYVRLARTGEEGIAEAMESLLDATDLYLSLCSEEIRKEAGDAWRIAEDALAFAEAYEGAACAEVKEGKGWESACCQLEERLLILGRSLDALIEGLSGTSCLRP